MVRRNERSSTNMTNMTDMTDMTDMYTETKPENPQGYVSYFSRRPHALIWKGSIIPHVIGQTIAVTIITIIITILFEFKVVDLSVAKTASVATSFSAIIGIVVSLLLTYRTNTAYDRYWEGRKLWSTMVVIIRHLTRYIWLGIREDGKKKVDGEVGTALTEIVIEKKTAINLLMGFAIAVKHYLREEHGFEHDDLKPLILSIKSNLPEFKTSADNAGNDNTMSPGTSSSEGWFTRAFCRKKELRPHLREKGAYVHRENLPMDIALYLTSYCQIQSDKGRIDVPISNQLLANLSGLCDCLSQFERILRSPIPLAYSIHLNQTVWIYCITLPFFLVSTSGWATIIIVFLVTLILFGLERIGAEIENPFGYDDNDLDLDGFCNLIQLELNLITSHPPPTIKDWIYVPENFPFDDRRISIIEAVKYNVDEVRSLLSVGSDKTSLEIVEEEEEEEEEEEGEYSEKAKGESDNITVSVQG